MDATAGAMGGEAIRQGKIDFGYLLILQFGFMIIYLGIFLSKQDKGVLWTFQGARTAHPY